MQQKKTSQVKNAKNGQKTPSIGTSSPSKIILPKGIKLFYVYGAAQRTKLVGRWRSTLCPPRFNQKYYTYHIYSVIQQEQWSWCVSSWMEEILTKIITNYDFLSYKERTKNSSHARVFCAFWHNGVSECVCVWGRENANWWVCLSCGIINCVRPFVTLLSTRIMKSGWQLNTTVRLNTSFIYLCRRRRRKERRDYCVHLAMYVSEREKSKSAA